MYKDVIELCMVFETYEVGYFAVFVGGRSACFKCKEVGMMCSKCVKK